MNDTQWIFELEAMNQAEAEKIRQIKAVSDILKKQVIRMLGLNLCPIEDEVTGLLRMPDDDECLPLAVMIGRDDVLKMLEDRRTEFVTQEEVRSQLGSKESVATSMEFPPDNIGVELTPEELEQFMNDPGDVEFENNHSDVAKALNWASALDRSILENVVLNRDDLDSSVDPLTQGSARTLGQVRQELSGGSAGRGAYSEEVPPSTDYEEITLVSDDVAESVSEGISVDLDKLIVVSEEDASD